MARVVIFGIGRGADTAYRYLSRDPRHELAGFTVDAAYRTRDELHGLPVVDYATLASRFPPGAHELFIPLGFQRMNRLRAERYADAKRLGYRCATYVHPNVRATEPPDLGENCFVLDGTLFDLDVRVGNDVTIWSGCHLGDRSTVGDHTWIASDASLAGDVTVGERCFLGVNCTISNGVRLGEGTFVGAQVLVSKDTAPGTVLVAPGATAVPLDSERFLAMLKIT